MRLTTKISVLFWTLSTTFIACAGSQEFSSYEKGSQDVSGNLSSIGSDTLANVMTLWAEKFKEYYPSVSVQIQAAGSSTAPQALINGAAQFGPMSREMKEKEVEAFEKRYGYKPTPVRVAIDALAVFVHKDNPIDGMVLSDLDAIFSSTKRCGGKNNITKWGDLDLKGSWTQRDIQLFGRNSVSGTYGYFKKVALCKGDFKNTVNEQPGSASVVQSIASSLNAIGYSGMGYLTSGVKVVSLGRDKSSLVSPTAESAAAGTYPLARFLYVYVNKEPGKPLGPMESEFLRMILSKEGQQVVEKDGYVAVPKSIAAIDLRKLAIN